MVRSSRRIGVALDGSTWVMKIAISSSAGSIQNAVDAAPPQKKFSSGTVLGHMHLNVGDLDVSQSFYESLGMELMAEAGHVMRFMSWDGYHHHLGINLLEGRGASPVEAGVRGLEGFDVRRVGEPRTDPNGIVLSPPA